MTGRIIDADVDALANVDRLTAQIEGLKAERDDALRIIDVWRGRHGVLVDDAAALGKRATEAERLAKRWEECAKAFERERDAYKRDYDAEIEGDADMRRLYGADATETLRMFVSRVVSERDEARMQIEVARGEKRKSDSQRDELERMLTASEKDRDAKLELMLRRVDEADAANERVRVLEGALRGMRCMVTNNPVGTDTRSKQCGCRSCIASSVLWDVPPAEAPAPTWSATAVPVETLQQSVLAMFQAANAAPIARDASVDDIEVTATEFAMDRKKWLRMASPTRVVRVVGDHGVELVAGGSLGDAPAPEVRVMCPGCNAYGHTVDGAGPSGVCAVCKGEGCLYVNANEEANRLRAVLASLSAELDEAHGRLDAANEEIERLTTLANNERAAWEAAVNAHAATTAKLGRAEARIAELEAQLEQRK